MGRQHFVMGKCRGINTARKLRVKRRIARWADKDYKKAHFGDSLKANAFGGTSHVKGIVVERVAVEAKQPNSGIRKCVRVHITKNMKKVMCFVPRDGCMNYIDENDQVIIAGLGRSGKATGDLPGVRFKVVKVSGVGLMAIYRGKKQKPSR